VLRVIADQYSREPAGIAPPSFWIAGDSRL
jgi:hypothetical protein